MEKNLIDRRMAQMRKVLNLKQIVKLGNQFYKRNFRQPRCCSLSISEVPRDLKVKAEV